MAKAMSDVAMIPALMEALRAVDLDAPDAPRLVNHLLKPLEVLTRAAPAVARAAMAAVAGGRPPPGGGGGPSGPGNTGGTDGPGLGPPPGAPPPSGDPPPAATPPPPFAGSAPHPSAAEGGTPAPGVPAPPRAVSSTPVTERRSGSRVHGRSGAALGGGAATVVGAGGLTTTPAVGPHRGIASVVAPTPPTVGGPQSAAVLGGVGSPDVALGASPDMAAGGDAFGGRDGPTMLRHAVEQMSVAQDLMAAMQAGSSPGGRRRRRRRMHPMGDSDDEMPDSDEDPGGGGDGMDGMDEGDDGDEGHDDGGVDHMEDSDDEHDLMLGGEDEDDDNDDDDDGDDDDGDDDDDGGGMGDGDGRRPVLTFAGGLGAAAATEMAAAEERRRQWRLMRVLGGGAAGGDTDSGGDGDGGGGDRGLAAAMFGGGDDDEGVDVDHDDIEAVLRRHRIRGLAAVRRVADAEGGAGGAGGGGAGGAGDGHDGDGPGDAHFLMDAGEGDHAHHHHHGGGGDGGDDGGDDDDSGGGHDDGGGPGGPGDDGDDGDDDDGDDDDGEDEGDPGADDGGAPLSGGEDDDDERAAAEADHRAMMEEHDLMGDGLVEVRWRGGGGGPPPLEPLYAGPPGGFVPAMHAVLPPNFAGDVLGGLGANPMDGILAMEGRLNHLFRRALGGGYAPPGGGAYGMGPYPGSSRHRGAYGPGATASRPAEGALAAERGRAAVAAAAAAGGGPVRPHPLLSRSSAPTNLADGTVAAFGPDGGAAVGHLGALDRLRAAVTAGVNPGAFGPDPLIFGLPPPLPAGYGQPPAALLEGLMNRVVAAVGATGGGLAAHHHAGGPGAMAEFRFRGRRVDLGDLPPEEMMAGGADGGDGLPRLIEDGERHGFAYGGGGGYYGGGGGFGYGGGGLGSRRGASSWSEDPPASNVAIATSLEPALMAMLRARAPPVSAPTVPPPTAAAPATVAAGEGERPVVTTAAVTAPATATAVVEAMAAPAAVVPAPTVTPAPDVAMATVVMAPPAPEPPVPAAEAAPATDAFPAAAPVPIPPPAAPVDADMGDAAPAIPAAAGGAGAGGDAPMDASHGLPTDIDPAFLAALPPEMQAEVMASRGIMHPPQRAPQPENAVVEGAAAGGGSSGADAGAGAAGPPPQETVDANAAPAGLDADFLAALPDDIRAELIAQDAAASAAAARARASAVAATAGGHGPDTDMDTASIIATFPPELRADVLMTADDALLSTLPASLQAEARVLRERTARAMATAAGAAPPGVGVGAATGRARAVDPRAYMRGLAAGYAAAVGGLGGGGPPPAAAAPGGAGHRLGGAVPSWLRTTAPGGPALGGVGGPDGPDWRQAASESAAASLCPQDVTALLRLLRLAAPLGKGLLQRLMLNLCGGGPGRCALLRGLLSMLRELPPGAVAAYIPEAEGLPALGPPSLDDALALSPAAAAAHAPRPLYGCLPHLVYARTPVAAAVPPLVSRRALEHAAHLARHEPRVTRCLLTLTIPPPDAASLLMGEAPHKGKGPAGLPPAGAPPGPDDVSALVLLLEMLGRPLVLSSSPHLEAALAIIDAVLHDAASEAAGRALAAATARVTAAEGALRVAEAAAAAATADREAAAAAVGRAQAAVDAAAAAGATAPAGGVGGGQSTASPEPPAAPVAPPAPTVVAPTPPAAPPDSMETSPPPLVEDPPAPLAVVRSHHLRPLLSLLATESLTSRAYAGAAGAVRALAAASPGHYGELTGQLAVLASGLGEAAAAELSRMATTPQGVQCAAAVGAGTALMRVLGLLLALISWAEPPPGAGVTPPPPAAAAGPVPGAAGAAGAAGVGDWRAAGAAAFAPAVAGGGRHFFGGRPGGGVDPPPDPALAPRHGAVPPEARAAATARLASLRGDLEPLWCALSIAVGALEEKMEAAATAAARAAADAPAGAPHGIGGDDEMREVEEDTDDDDGGGEGGGGGGRAEPASAAAPALPLGATAVLPLVEAFFVLCETAMPPRGADTPDGLLTLSRAPSTVPGGEGSHAPAMTPPSPSIVGRAGSGVEEAAAAASPPFLRFAERHRRLLNALVRQTPSLLQGSLALLLRSPRLLDFDNKRAHFRGRMRALLDAERGRAGGTLRLAVRRSHVLEDSFHQLRMRTPGELRGRLQVHFAGEEGVDAGGLTREWYVVLGREVFNSDNALFVTAPNGCTFQPNPNSAVNPEHLSYFKFVGRVVAKALCDGQLLDAYLTRSFYKHILGQPITVEDVEGIDPDFHKNLKWTLEHDISDLGLGLTFSAEADEQAVALFGTAAVVDLIEGGRHVAVTEANKRQYADLVVQHRLTTAIKPQLTEFLAGFSELVPRPLLAIFNDHELELLISGLPEIDVEDLRENTEYAGYTAQSPLIRWLWDVLRSLGKQDLALFLQFCTGTSKVPLDGFKALQGISGPQRFQVHKAYGPPDRLPAAHTCFNQLDLVEYESKDQLYARLLLAIREGREGFGFV